MKQNINLVIINNKSPSYIQGGLLENIRKILREQLDNFLENCWASFGELWGSFTGAYRQFENFCMVFGQFLKTRYIFTGIFGHIY